jgi:hypothetical protein
MMHGPATEALERSFKRIKVDPQQQCSASYIEAAFNFHDAFDQVSAVGASSSYEHYESFPSIGWNFYDDSDDDDQHYTSNVSRSSSLQTPIRSAVESTSSSSSDGKKRNRSGMLRSKTFSQNLCDLEETIDEPSSFNFEFCNAAQQQSTVVQDSTCKQTSLETSLNDNNTFVFDNSSCASNGCKLSLTKNQSSFSTMSRLSSRASLFTTATLSGSRRLKTMAALAC